MIIRKVFFAMFGFSVIIGSMFAVQFTKEESKEIKKRIREIEFSIEQKYGCWAGCEERRQLHIKDQIKIIEKILTKYEIPSPNKTYLLEWVGKIREMLPQKKQVDKKQVDEKQESYHKDLDISGLPKKELAKALYENATSGPNILNFCGKELSEKDLKLLTTSYVDYLHGKVMKIDISGNTVDTFLYNRDNGPLAAENVICELCKKLKS